MTKDQKVTKGNVGFVTLPAGLPFRAFSRTRTIQRS